MARRYVNTYNWYYGITMVLVVGTMVIDTANIHSVAGSLYVHEICFFTFYIVIQMILRVNILNIVKG